VTDAAETATPTSSPEAQDASAPPPAADARRDVRLDGGFIHGFGPSDFAPLDDVACTDPAELPAIALRVREAAHAHASRSLDKRARLLEKLSDAILARADAVADALAKECGKPEAESFLHEIVPTADLAAYWAFEGPELLASYEPVLDAISYPKKRAVVERLPRGVIGLITPWNFPVAIPLRTLFPALLAGDGVVWKPSEHTPRCAQVIGEALAEVYGPDLVVLVQGGGEVGAKLIGSGIDAVVFTGSVPTGRKVARGAAEALIPAGLELGGKDAAIVLDDANLERAARGILWGAMANAGQNCAAIERVYATPKVAGPLARRLAELAKELRPGKDLGPLTTDAQLRIVERHVESARSAGAEVLAGGARAPGEGRFYAATVLAKVPREADLIVEETFGPVVPVIEVADADAAVAAANESAYGLTASVWTKNVSKGEKLARRLRAGTVVVNNHGFTGAIPALPWGGFAETGYGITNSPHALDVLTRPRAVVVDRMRGKREMWWHPYTPGLVQVGRALATLKSGAGIGRKVKAVFQLIGGFARRWKV
jgi:acyl-CoA reductase-like NAD-dependent aldehyde dehydrogenase